MSRALGALAVVAILAGGCASRSAVGRLESEVVKLRSELAELRVAQEVTARDLARVAPQIQTLDARVSEVQVSGRALTDEIARLTRRADATDTAVGETKSRVEALTPSPPPKPAAPAAALSPGIDRPRVPPAPAPSAVPAPPTTAAPPAAPDAPAALAAPTPSITPTPPVTLVPPVTPARPVPRAGSPEQEYAAALATFRAREHGQAVLDLVDFIAKYPKHSLAGNAQYWIGEAYWAQRDYRQALVEFEKVFEHGPGGKVPDALVKIGLCHVRLHDPTRAQNAWQRAVREYPRSEAAATAQSLLRTHAAVRQ